MCKKAYVGDNPSSIPPELGLTESGDSLYKIVNIMFRGGRTYGPTMLCLDGYNYVVWIGTNFTRILSLKRYIIYSFVVP